MDIDSGYVARGVGRPATPAREVRSCPCKHALLGLLAQGPQHGYDLKTAFEADLSPDSPLNFGQVYTTLERLERDGLVAHHVVAQEERPDKKVYRLTDAGRAELERWLATPSSSALDLRNETFLKLFLARRLAAGAGATSAAGGRTR